MGLCVRNRSCLPNDPGKEVSLISSILRLIWRQCQTNETSDNVHKKLSQGILQEEFFFGLGNNIDVQDQCPSLLSKNINGKGKARLRFL